MLFLVFLVVLVLLVLPVYIVYKPPHVLIRYFQYRWPDVLWHVPTTKKIVALTIDDAPSEYTNEILEVLRENNATATFFVIGKQAEGQRDKLVTIINGRHELGNHAMYDEPSRSLSDEKLRDQITTVQTHIEHAYASTDVSLPAKLFFRPGSGFFSLRMRQLIANMGYQMALGNVYPHDPQIPYSGVNAKHILSMVQPGSIIICHDRRSWTPPMLRQVLPELRQRGFEIVTLTELLQKTDSQMLRTSKTVTVEVAKSSSSSTKPDSAGDKDAG